MVNEHFEGEYNVGITFLNPQQNVYKKRDFKACEGAKSGAYYRYVSIFDTSITQKSPF